MEEGEIRDSPPLVQHQAHARFEIVGSLSAFVFKPRGLIFRVRSVRTISNIESQSATFLSAICLLYGHSARIESVMFLRESCRQSACLQQNTSL
jgi:hypothetical protein